MSTEVDPIVGNWYQHLDKGQRFLVVAFDDASVSMQTAALLSFLLLVAEWVCSFPFFASL
ncbi:DUF6763 family protein [Kaarinaea lacus]